MTEPVPGSDLKRLTILGHGLAGLAAGWTRHVVLLSRIRNKINWAFSAFVATPIELIKG